MHSVTRGTGGATMVSDGSRRHVLVVDDSEEILRLLREVLEEEGHRVTTSADPVGADEVVRAAPDVIVLDVLFGSEQRGIDLLRELRDDDATADIPVVLCSAAVEPIRRIDGDLLGETTGLVLKPFDIDGLLAEVKRVIASGDGASGSRDERW
jgi:CheY-like chemotaxis protein